MREDINDRVKARFLISKLKIQEELMMYEDAAISEIMDELRRARILHPNWPHDIIYQAAVVCEESGELLKAVNDYHHHGKGTMDDIRDELIQTGAMVVRMLVNLPDGLRIKDKK